MKDLAIAYAMRKRAMKRKMASGGVVEPEEQMHSLDESVDPMEGSEEQMAEPMMHEEIEPPKKKRGIIEAIMHKAHQRHFGK